MISTVDLFLVKQNPVPVCSKDLRLVFACIRVYSKCALKTPLDIGCSVSLVGQKVKI